uniref:Uncharacterized protein n=1 Tax=Quercus lobata TaxID=97700 RepID=A0A7N2LB99_QUELO
MENGKLYGSLRDEKIYCSCDTHIFTNSRKRRSMVRARYSDLKCNHLWFYGEPHSRLQTRFGDLMQGVDNYETTKVSRSGAQILMEINVVIFILSLRSPVMLFLNTSSVTCNFGGNNPGPNSHRRCSCQGLLWRPAWSNGSFEEERNLTPRQSELIEEFAREEQREYEKCATAGASG